MRTRLSTTPATSWGSWSGTISRTPVPSIPTNSVGCGGSYTAPDYRKILSLVTVSHNKRTEGVECSAAPGEVSAFSLADMGKGGLMRHRDGAGSANGSLAAQ